MEQFQLNTDGGARGNPGPAAIGVVLQNAAGGVVASFGKTIGSTTNNQAEYQAIVAGLKLAQEHHVQSLLVCADSELVIKQLRGEYKVKNAELKPWHSEATQLIRSFPQITLEAIRREKNAAADALVNQALDAAI